MIVFTLALVLSGLDAARCRPATWPTISAKHFNYAEFRAPLMATAASLFAAHDAGRPFISTPYVRPLRVYAITQDARRLH